MANGTVKRMPIIKCGLLEIGTVGANTGKIVTISFDDPMPDANYTVIVCSANSASLFASCVFYAREDTRTANGVDVGVWHNGSGTTGSLQVFWTAIHL